jgi:2-dehydro-3-deoxyphosphooctonate aldolase (KDO 8-P synthase)
MNSSFLDTLFSNQPNKAGFFLLAGPCVIESEALLQETCGTLVEICKALGIPLVFKSSYKKANRTSLDSFTGIGDEEALLYLSKTAQHFGVPCVTDIHTEEQAIFAAKYVDVLQIPAFLSRQTDLLIAAAKTGKVVNIKKGQFLNAVVIKILCLQKEAIVLVTATLWWTLEIFRRCKHLATL